MKEKLRMNKRNLMILLNLIFGIGVMKSASWYDTMTYSWTDASGVVHNAVPVTDKATSTEQIMALLKTIYSNPSAPGSYYGFVPNSTSYRTVNYKNGKNATNLTTYWGIPSSGVTKPTTDGTTMLFVEFYDTWNKNLFNNGTYFNDGGTGYPKKNEAYKSIAEAYKSVQLVTSQIRIQNSSLSPDYGAGTVFNISGTFNRFGFISKGQPALQDNGYYPLYGMYEEYSPTTGDATTFADVYDDLIAGNSYNIIHDCASLAYLNHFFAMRDDGTSHQAFNVNMCMFVPDYRFDSTSASDVDYKVGYQPKIMLYTVNLTATATQATTPTNTYNVTLNWVSSFDKLNTSVTVPEQFYVYTVVNGVISTTPLAGPLTTTTYTYQVPQLPNSEQDISYVVSAKPTASTFNPVYSNVASVSIPGYTVTQKLGLALNGNVNSVYSYTNQENDYTNNLLLTNATTTPIVRRELPNNTTFTINRSWTDASNVTNKVKVATINIVSQSTVGTNYVYNYTVTYTNKASGVTYPPTTGTLTSLVSAGDAGVVNFGTGIPILDIFNASTTLNQQPNQYIYKAVYTLGGHPADQEDAYSNQITVNIPKTSYTLAQQTYTTAQVTGDVNRKLVIDNSQNISFQVTNNPDIFGYMIMRDNVEICFAQHTQDGNYTLMKRDSYGGLNVKVGDVIFPTGQNVTTAVFNDDLGDASATTSDKYVIIIQTKNKVNDVYPTYGSDIQSGSAIKVSVSLTDEMKNIYFYIDNNGVKGTAYRVEKDIAASVTSDALQFDHFNVWRYVDGVENYVDFSTAGTAYESDYYINQTTDGLNVKCAEAFQDKILGTGETLPYTYYVRIYAKVKNTTSNSMLDALPVGSYMIAEAKVSDQFDGTTPTGVNGVTDDLTNVMVYPNITNSTTTVNGEGEISIYSVSGVKVMTINDGNNTRSVDVSSLPNGFYMVTCKGKSMQLVKK